MRFFALLFVLPVVIASAAAAQQEPPVLRAKSPSVDVQDGPRLRRGVWTVDPSVALDVFNAGRSDKPRTITFISDIDRLSFEVVPNQVYDFVVLLDNQHRCATRISTFVQPFSPIKPGAAPGPVAIPFSFDQARIMVSVNVNGSEPLDLLFDTGADATVISTKTLAKGVTARVDGTQSHQGFGGTSISQSASDNTIELAGIRWTHEPILWTDGPVIAGDGILGAHVFEDKVVEIDFDRRLLIVHDALPSNAATFTELPMQGLGRTFSIETSLAGARSSGTVPVFFDSGFAGALMVYHASDQAMGLRATLSRVGRSFTSGTGRGGINCDVLVLPELSIAGRTFKDLPIHVEDPGTNAPSGYEGGVLGMDVIKRFNLILDYPRDRAYFSPNTLMGSPYSITVPPPPVGAIVALAALPVGMAFGAVWYRARRARLRGVAAAA